MSYLDDTRYATAALFEKISAGKAELANQQRALDQLKQEFDVFERDYRSMDLSEDFCEIRLMAAGRRAHNTFRDFSEVMNEVDRLRSSMADRDFARRSLAGAVLQIAKQGLGKGWDRFLDVPNLRSIGTVHIAELIWEGRNHSAHFDVAPNRPGIRRVFAALRKSGLIDFDVTQEPFVNRSLEVLNLLGWHDLSSYEHDMTELLRERS